MEGRHVGLDFYDLLIEVLWRFITNYGFSSLPWLKRFITAERL
jgi:hypothetical protein